MPAYASSRREVEEEWGCRLSLGSNSVSSTSPEEVRTSSMKSSWPLKAESRPRPLSLGPVRTSVVQFFANVLRSAAPEGILEALESTAGLSFHFDCTIAEKIGSTANWVWGSGCGDSFCSDISEALSSLCLAIMAEHESGRTLVRT